MMCCDYFLLFFRHEGRGHSQVSTHIVDIVTLAIHFTSHIVFDPSIHPSIIFFHSDRAMDLNVLGQFPRQH